MLQAMLQAELEAVLRAQLQAAVHSAETPPSPSGSLPALLSTQPTSPLVDLCYSRPGVAVSWKGQETPLHPPLRRRGDKGHRKAKRKAHVEYWHELLAYIDSTYVKKFGRHYPWNNLGRRNLYNMARVHAPWRVMALWELYLESKSWWARQTGWSVYGMMRDTGNLMDDSRFKDLGERHEKTLARRCQRRFAILVDLPVREATSAARETGRIGGKHPEFLQPASYMAPPTMHFS